MANRHLLRTIALQSLFEWDFHDQKGDISEIFDRVVNEFTKGEQDNEFAKELMEGVVKNITDINKIIVENAPEWPLSQITIIDRNVLRLGIYEMMFIKDTPAKVVINEAVEMGKSFGGESSGKFVNGVLGTLYKNLPPESLNDSEKNNESKQAAN